ncbi:MAG: hypothetical protein RMM16_06100 [Chloroherpetonaceae bacterium]|nr:hypothetical protein [Chloroherpetonaceae bacterium]
MTKTAELLPTQRQLLFDRMADKLEIAYNLSRRVVSFQANKDEPIYRWFKYKEGFSSALVRYFLKEYGSMPGKLLDPFAGAGTTLFVGQELGWESYGIELLPVGLFVIQAREALNHIDVEDLKTIAKNIWKDLSRMEEYDVHVKHIPITKDVFPIETEISLNKFLTYCSKIKDEKLQTLLRFAAFSVLEEISYTRKDGQYLRWDYRSKRDLSGKPFDKGKIPTLEEALTNKLHQFISDLSFNRPTNLFENFSDAQNANPKPVKYISGSCLEELPKFPDNYFDFILTSPPYCNRYDYTRTYALELIFLGKDNDQVRNLRQSMLSCTVENKDKLDRLRQFYSSIGRPDAFREIISAYDGSAAMREINETLCQLNKLGKLNNSHIPRMVKNYFLEMCFVIYEMARITKSGGYCVMVNDNVRYGGEEIPIDLILSEFAENFGYNIDKIFILPKGKGNSSQQMGNHGRSEVRKCVYLWQKK